MNKITKPDTSIHDSHVREIIIPIHANIAISVPIKEENGRLKLVPRLMTIIHKERVAKLKRGIKN